MAKRKYSISDAQAREICEKVKETSLTFKEACRLVGVSYDAWRAAVSGDDPPKPKWREWKDQAKAYSEANWIKKGEEYAAAKNNPGVRFCEFMLKSLNPERYREKDTQANAGVVVEIVQGPMREAATVAIRSGGEEQVIDGSAERRRIEARQQ